MNKLLLTTAVLLATFSIHSNAQQWEWGKRGGSPTPATNNVEETVFDMTTDKWGNIYVLGRAYQIGMNIDGQALTGFGSDDMIFASFTCGGSLRWAKPIGSSGPDGFVPNIKTDTLGGVYFTCQLAAIGQQCNFDADTFVTNTYKRMFLVKYDTAGVYKWMKIPQDTVTAVYNFTWAIDLDVDGAGNIDMFCRLYPGAYANSSYIITDTGMHILRYNAQGNFVNGIALQMDVTDVKLGYIKMKKNHRTGRYYFTGSASNLLGGDLILGGNLVNNPMYVTSFNAQGQYLWKRENVNDYAWGFRGRPAIDDSGNVYVCGASWHNDTFMTYHVVNTLMTAGGDQPFIAKLDSNGNLKWAKAGSADGATNGYSIAMRNQNEIVMVGSYPGKVQWPGYAGPHPNHANNQNYDVFITSFNAHTGAVNDVDTLGGVFGGFDEPTCIVADRNNNVYLGGRYGGSMYVGTADTLQLTGGQSDFFIVKHGYASCMPQGVNEVETTNEIVIYPNPVTELLQVKGLQAATNFRMLSITGAVMQTGVLEQNNKGISTEGLAPGMYLLELNGVQQKGVVRFVKQ